MRTTRSRHYLSLTAFLVFLALLLLSVVDIRRGFLFTGYFKVGAPSALLNLSLPQLPLLVIGVLGAWLAYKYMSKLEKGLKEKRVDLKNLARVVAVVIGAFMVIDLFIYRGVPASRFLAVGKMAPGSGPMGLSWAIPIGSFPGWLQPFGEGINYMLVVWHATTLGMLLGGLFLVAGAGLITRLRGNGLTSHLAGSGIALAQPFCSCCAAPIGSALYRRGASLGPVLAFTVSAPMLNITSLILAVALLPARFALLRVAGGIVVGVFLTYGVALVAARWLKEEEAEGQHGKPFEWSAKLVATYSRFSASRDYF